MAFNHYLGGRWHMADLVGQVIGQYQIVEQLGRGGMADVYKAFHPGLSIYRALKVIRREFVTETGFRERFQREAQAVASLRHPNIVQMHDFGVQDDLYYMVMEFIEGQDLKTYLLKQGQLRPFDRIVSIIEQVASALGYAHQRGVIHRDIKPANIMLTAEGQVILTDFGIAKMVTQTERMTQTGVGIGTPSYMSPEQARGLPNVGPASDIYSLGIVLYEMLTGQVPFSADTPLAVMLKVVSDPLPPPRDFSPDIPDVLQGVVLKATAKDPARRYQTTEAFVDSLKRSLNMATEAGTSARTSPGDSQATRLAGASATVADAVPPKAKKARPQSQPKKNRSTPWLLIGGGLLVLLCFVAAAAAGLWYYFRPTPSLANWQFVVDASQGMNETIDGRTKMDIARAGMAEELKILPSNVNAGLRIFGGGQSGADPCQDTQLLVKPATQQGPQLVSALSGVTPAGEAPLTQAIVQAIGDFDLTRDTKNTLIVITSGLDTCDSNAVSQLQELSRRLGIQFDLQLIGLGVAESDQGQLQQIAEAAGGEFHNADTEEEFRQVVTARLSDTIPPLPSAPVAPQTGEGGLALGQSVSGQIAAGQSTQYTFEAQAGQTIYFQFESASEGTYFKLTGPDRAELFNVYNGNKGPVELAPAGTYTLDVTPDGETSSTYAFTVWEVNPPLIEGGEITFGQFIDGQIQIPGQRVHYTFEGQAGQTIYFQFDSATEGTYFTLTGPARTELFSVYNSNKGPVELAQAGAYTLLVNADGPVKPKYSFTMWDINPPLIEGGEITFGQFIDGQIQIPGQRVHYTFEGQAGQTIYFQFDSATEGAYFTLTGPDRTELFRVYNGNKGPVELAQAGTYTLLVNADGPAKPKYTFVMWDINPPLIDGGGLTFGQFVDGQIQIPGQRVQYTFEAQAGQTIYFQFDSASEGAYFTLTGPARTELFNVYNGNQGPIALEQAGTYTLQVNADGEGKPKFSFAIWEVKPAIIDGGALTFGQPIDGQIQIPGQRAQYTFEGQAGQSIDFQFDSASEGTYFTLLAPDSSELFSVYNGNQGPIALEQAGTYTLQVNADGAGKPKYTFRINLE
jgi:serine/threonine protein kinase